MSRMAEKITVAVCIVIIALALILPWKYIHRVRAYWRGNTLQVSTGANGLAVTHLTGWSQGQPAVAILPEPRITVDSGGPSFDEKTLKALPWKSARTEEPMAAPAIGSEIHVGYYYPTYARVEP